jgi:hypothetical protein
MEHPTFQSKPILLPHRFPRDVNQTLKNAVGGRKLQTGPMVEEPKIGRMGLQQRDKESTSTEGLVKSLVGSKSKGCKAVIVPAQMASQRRMPSHPLSYEFLQAKIQILDIQVRKKLEER